MGTTKAAFGLSKERVGAPRAARQPDNRRSAALYAGMACLGALCVGQAHAGLAADTSITRVDGGSAAIDTIKAGAVLEGADGHPLPVMARFAQGPVSGAVRITTEAGRSLVLTPEHAVITPGGGVPAATVAIGDHVVSVDGVDTVSGVETLPRGGRVVTLMPTPGHPVAQHFANGLLVDMAGHYGPKDISLETVPMPVPAMPVPPMPSPGATGGVAGGEGDAAAPTAEAAQPRPGTAPTEAPPPFSLADLPPWMLMGYPGAEPSSDNDEGSAGAFAPGSYPAVPPMAFAPPKMPSMPRVTPGMGGQPGPVGAMPYGGPYAGMSYPVPNAAVPGGQMGGGYPTPKQAAPYRVFPGQAGPYTGPTWNGSVGGTPSPLQGKSPYGVKGYGPYGYGPYGYGPYGYGPYGYGKGPGGMSYPTPAWMGAPNTPTGAYR
ncbi:MAG: Hint domain-containing protein, partial [Gammaproteobacteria bacterium]